MENFKVPQIGGKELNLCKLFKAAILRGGFQRVTTNKLWKEIVNQFEIPSSCTSASFTLKSHFTRCLWQYEKKFYESQGNTNSSGLTPEGLPPLRPGVPHLIDQRGGGSAANEPPLSGFAANQAASAAGVQFPPFK